ncbi:MAG: phosphorylase, partial [Desulfobulbaceae bacterium]|nr:phosphorylase [Candidatus Desulfatifera sulfidica]
MSETTCEEMVIEPGRRRSEKLLPGAGCLLVNPQDAAVACDQLLRDGGTRRFLFNSTLIVSRDETFFVAGPAMGAPMAVMTLEKLIALGAQRI